VEREGGGERREGRGERKAFPLFLFYETTTELQQLNINLLLSNILYG